MTGDTTTSQDEMDDAETPLRMPSGSAIRNVPFSSEYKMHRVSDSGDSANAIDN